MLETTLVALQDIMLHKILDDAGQKVLLSEFSKIMQLLSHNCSNIQTIVIWSLTQVAISLKPNNYFNKILENHILQIKNIS
ncbi:hypothetical protein DCAR_0727352 [Daucus carota subsp. sativus]|uniref:Uncharacterized protein n=1 Tax=Daucus carota subsp. sativus TaxID=79200 RepID=A0AAF0XIT0_DAUCS|nr:hypothetical protein DCAR_0727352 [Daucus carota subsp. sativus]